MRNRKAIRGRAQWRKAANKRKYFERVAERRRRAYAAALDRFNSMTPEQVQAELVKRGGR
jgi:hypothetical protein